MNRLTVGTASRSLRGQAFFITHTVSSTAIFKRKKRHVPGVAMRYLFNALGRNEWSIKLDTDPNCYHEFTSKKGFYQQVWLLLRGIR